MDTPKHIQCTEWVSVNRNARLTVTQKEDNFKKNKSQKNKTYAKKTDLTKTDEVSALYLIQVVGQKFSENNLLACLTSDQVVNIYDQNTLKSRFQIRRRLKDAQNLNEVGFYKQDRNMVYTCGDDGILRIYDMRIAEGSTEMFHRDEISFSSPTPREFLCADINADDSMFSIGTNKNVDDAQVYIFDVRFNTKHLYQLCESHSMNITQVKFDPTQRQKFSSGSTDGLVCLYDINESSVKKELPTGQLNKSKSDDGEDSSVEDEDPDFMEQVFNTDSSILKMGYLSSSAASEKCDQLYAITYTNGMFIWDLDTHDQIYRSPKEFNNKDVAGNEKESDDDFYLDCFYRQSWINSEDYVLATCMSDKYGNVKVYEKDVLMLETDRSNRFEKRFHKDIIRDSYWNGQDLFTCGEDGFLLKWNLSGEDVEKELTGLKQKERRDDTESEEELERLNEEQMNKKVKFRKNKFSRRNK